MNALTIATRGSQLALWQAHHIRDSILSKHPHVPVSIQVIKTTGDRIQDRPLAKIGGKGLFVKEIEQALIEKKADLAVHSMKDLPADLPAGLSIVAIPLREDPRDALIAPKYKKLEQLPLRAKIGTSSLRRGLQLKQHRPDLIIENLRGNVDTRLRKVEEGQYDAIVLAYSGLIRLGWEERVTEVLNPAIMLPAVAQGALGVEARSTDAQTHHYLSHLMDSSSRDRVLAERAALKTLEGTCQTPLGGYAEIAGEQIRLSLWISDLEGKHFLRKTFTGARHHPEQLGRDAAESLLAQGGAEIMDSI